MEQEEGTQLGRARDYALLKFVWMYVRPYRRLFFLSAILMPLNAAFALAQPYIIQLIIDLFLAHRRVAPPPWLAAFFRETVCSSRRPIGVVCVAPGAAEYAAFFGHVYLR